MIIAYDEKGEFMVKEELVVCFQNTLQMSQQGIIRERTIDAINSNKVYKEGFISENKTRNAYGEVAVYSGTTFDIAKRYCQYGKVAVLNFANPEFPGGGVANGAMAQEECLCRSSNLYACISNENVFEEYYDLHRRLKNAFYTDRLIYSEGVTVFKNDDIVPQLMPEEDWFEVDVITCAAPYVAKRKYTNSTALLSLFTKRIKNIFEAARDNKVDVIVLGAFGCGAFKNPPLIVAEAFAQVIKEENYLEKFKYIVFAIKPTGDNCPNLSAFKIKFDVYVAEAEGRCSLLQEPIEWRFNRMPNLSNKDFAIDEREFLSWQLDNKYFGKQFSILGDSISTLEGYNPRGYKVFYAGENSKKSGVIDMQDTWWDKVISYFGGELLVNNSWSGSRVTKLSNREDSFPSGCSDERTSALHINDVYPDVIIVYLGTNDWAVGADTGNEVRILGTEDNEIFSYAYENMLKKLKSNYPKSEIWCCTLSETYISKKSDFVFPHSHAGIHIEEYNTIIREIVRENGCNLIDLYSYKMPYDSLDGSHPTSEGMDTIAEMVIRSMLNSEEESFLECFESEHDYEMVGQTGTYNFYKCVKCGKEKTECSWELLVSQEEMESPIEESEYVLLPLDITRLLYGNTIKLTVESTGKVITIQKDVINVGRATESDLLLTAKTIARRQATFFFENNTWFIRDNNTTNGTWLNGVRLKHGKKYELQAGDEINFAMSEKVIFFKRESVEQSKGDLDEKAVIMLTAGMKVFAESQQKDEVAFKLILSSLIDAPLFFPVEIDVASIFGNINPENLKLGDVIQTKEDTRIKILTLGINDIEVIPMFTSQIEAQKGPNISTIRYFPQDYIPMLLKMDKPMIIDPFSEHRFILPKDLLVDLLLLVKDKKNSDVSMEEKMETTTDKYIGTTIANEYIVLRLLGEGGFYKTYLVEDIRFKKMWAMKTCDKMHKQYKGYLKDEILKESYIMKKLSHPAIPLVVDILEDSDSIFIVREYIEGQSLKQIVTDCGALAEEQVIEWAKELCDMLAYLHNQTPPHIYRDMKPANIVLMKDNHVKVIDFGIVRLYDESKRGDTCCLGTKGYAAPEQFGGMGQTDARTDIFGLGMTMHHLVTGCDPNEPPYEVKPIREINPSLSKGLEYIITKCIAPNPDNRYQSAKELLDDLNNYKNLPKPKGLFEKLFGKNKNRHR